MQRGLLLLLLIAGLLAMPLARAQTLVPVPPLSAHLVDQLNLLTPPQQAALEELLQRYETRTGSQIAVLLLASTAPEAIEQYSIRVADAWKLGRKGVDDSVILLVAKDNPKALRRLRIETGRGVQGVLTDLQSKRILQEVIAPYFQRNDFNGGLAAGVTAIIALLDQETFPAPAAPAATSTPEALSLPLLLMVIGLFFLLPVLARRGRGRTVLGHGNWGRTAGVILGSGIGSTMGGGRSGGGNSGGGFSGGGGGFDGGGASGDW